MTLLTLVGLAGFAFAGGDDSSDKLGLKIEPTFVDAAGKPVPSKGLFGSKATVVIVTSFDCPNSNNYTPTLIDLAKRYGDKGVKFIALAVNEMTAPELKAKIAEYKIPYPVFADPNLNVADAFKAKITPEVFVLDHNQVMRYRGRIDNMFSERLKRNPKVTDHDLENALDDLLAGKPVRKPVTMAVGCPLPGRDVVVKTPTKVTYHKDVAPIIQKNCQGCHRPGEVGPFSLMTYKQAVTWAEDIKDYSGNRKMPPWKPTGGVFAFHNDRRMAEADIKTLGEWVDGGVPEGDPKDAPKPIAYPEGWMLGKPDLILSVNEDFHLGPSGPDTFRCYVLPTNLPEDRYIIGFEVKPGNPGIVHHTLNFWDLSGKARDLQKKAKEKAAADDRDRGPGYSAAMGVGFLPGKSPRPGISAIGNFGGWAPGQVPRFLPEGTGYLLPKGADVIIQTHYHRNGKAESDRTKIGLYFAKKPVKHPYQTLTISPRNPFFLNIPAGEANHKIGGSVYVQSDCTMYSVMPHMHLIGKSVKITMTPPDGQKLTLVDITDWDYNWQETYWFKKPLNLKAGTKLEIEAIFDNSSKNPNNPSNPPKRVMFGEQTTNEMLFGFCGVTSEGNKRVRASVSPPKPSANK